MSKKQLKSKNMEALIEQLMQNGYRVIAPVKNGDLVLFDKIESFSDITFDYINPDRPMKEFFFPRAESVLTYDLGKDEIRISGPEKDFPKTVIIGSRPCDAAGLPTMDKVFYSEYKDDLYQARREATTILSIACTDYDDACFCTTAGYSPRGTEGSDVLLIKTSEEDFYVEALTKKGESLIKEAGKIFNEAKKEPRGLNEFKGPPVRFAKDKIKPWLDENFEHEFWQKIALKCIGCGSCSYLCPTCHCFDIIDDTGLNSGERLRNWDSCSFSLFTLHASGHNPRPNQASRYRQRIMHKYKYFVDNFGTSSCVGCGRCLRSCPVDMNMIEILSQIAETETVL